MSSGEGGGKKSRSGVKTPSASPLSAAERTKADILDIATAEFAENGYNGARVDVIAAKTQTSKRMIYYHFGDKEGLFTAVLEESYRRMRAYERTLDVEKIDPESAMRALVAGTFDYQASHERFVRLVADENVHRGAHLKNTGVAGSFGSGVIDMLTGIYERGVGCGRFPARNFRPAFAYDDQRAGFFQCCQQCDIFTHLQPRHDEPQGSGGAAPSRGRNRDALRTRSLIFDATPGMRRLVLLDKRTSSYILAVLALAS